MDHAVMAGPESNTWIVECKAVTDERYGDWRTVVDRRQLDEYVAHRIPAVYVFLTQPPDELRPFDRPCNTKPCVGGQCKSCAYDVRTFSDQLAHIEKAPPTRRIQPWFGHWAWTVVARELERLMASHWSSRGRPRTHEATDGFFNVMSAEFGMKRLCHFLAEATAGKPELAANVEVFWRLDNTSRRAGSDSTPPLTLEMRSTPARRVRPERRRTMGGRRVCPLMPGSVGSVSF